MANYQQFNNSIFYTVTKARLFCVQGFTMYAQRRIEEKLFGKPFYALEAATGQSLLDVQYDLNGVVSYFISSVKFFFN